MPAESQASVISLSVGETFGSVMIAFTSKELPANKISAFGGDYGFVDGVYGHQLLARQNVAASLAAKVAGGSMDLDRAKQIAQWMFIDNPTRLFGLADRLKAAGAAKPAAKKGPRIKLRPTPVV